MKDRIKQIMESEQLTPSAFADKLQLGRAVISHILNGRNNPSLDVVTRILSKIDYINSDWLITGKGEMYKTDYSDNNKYSHTNIKTEQPDLFSQNTISRPIINAETEYCKEIEVEELQKSDEVAEIKQVVYQKAPERKITKIIIYYSDNTFETFNADKTPL